MSWVGPMNLETSLVEAGLMSPETSLVGGSRFLSLLRTCFRLENSLERRWVLFCVTRVDRQCRQGIADNTMEPADELGGTDEP